MRWPFSRRKDADPIAGRARAVPVTPQPEPPDPRSDREVVEALAAQNLPDGVRERWLALLRPAVRLVPAAGGAPVARLGGLPVLPDDVPWPAWEGKGPLAYVGEVDCAALAGFELDLALPASGRLLFFYFDGRQDDGGTTVGYWEPDTRDGYRALHLPDGGGSPRQPPADELLFPEAAFAGLAVVSAPGWEHPDLRAEFLHPGEEHHSFMEHPVNADDFAEALNERHSGPNHQIGGYADLVQGPIEAEVAQFALGNVPWDDPRLEAEQARWRPLLQVDSDDDLDMMWGDVGVLYWAVRPDDLAAGDLTRIGFTWQCG